MAKYFLLFTLIPLVELMLLIKIGGYVGFLPTVLLVIITGGIGVFLARNQGLLVLSQIRNDMEYGIVPGNSILEGLIVLVGSAFLITPGLITDTVGFLFLLPFSRVAIREFLKQKIKKMIDEGKINFSIRKF